MENKTNTNTNALEQFIQSNQVATISDRYNAMCAVVDGCENPDDTASAIKHLEDASRKSDLQTEAVYAVMGKALKLFKAQCKANSKDEFADALKAHGMTMNVSTAYAYMKCFRIWEDCKGDGITIDAQMLRLLADQSSDNYELCKERIQGGSITDFNGLKLFADSLKSSSPKAKAKADAKAKAKADAEAKAKANATNTVDNTESVNLDAFVKYITDAKWVSVTVRTADGYIKNFINADAQTEQKPEQKPEQKKTK